MEFNWQGRYDGDDPLYHRVFQRVKNCNDFQEIKKNDFVLQGFTVDEGVERNKGRSGAAGAPNIIRKNLSNFPVVQADFNLLDFGNVDCIDKNLESAQKAFAYNVAEIIKQGGKSIALGGGHEITFAHYSGLRKALPDAKIGIINFDAHFDNREPTDGLASSGTGFWQISQEGPINSMHIGIQRNSNTLKLFDTAHHLGMNYILAEEIFFENLPRLYIEINRFLESVDVVYLTICMDVFNAAIAPGVSALAYNGISADVSFMNLYRHILASHKLLALDVAEVNPEFDIQDRTARLAASLVNELFMI